MEFLLSKIKELNDDVKRNIVNIAQSDGVFDDLEADKQDLDAANRLLTDSVSRTHFSNYITDFDYSAAIAYPFETEPYMASRFSDGSYPVWYGSMETETTIYETVFHMLQTLSTIEGAFDEARIVRHRSLYDVHCQAIVFDITDEAKTHKELVSNDYAYCQAIGKRIYKGNYPGLLSNSARSKGENVNIFQPDVLANPRLTSNLVYQLSPAESTVEVKTLDAQTVMTIRMDYYGGIAW